MTTRLHPGSSPSNPTASRRSHWMPRGVSTELGEIALWFYIRIGLAALRKLSSRLEGSIHVYWLGSLYFSRNCLVGLFCLFFVMILFFRHTSLALRSLCLAEILRKLAPDGRPILLSAVSISILTTVQKFMGFVYQMVEEKQKLPEMI